MKTDEASWLKQAQKGDEEAFTSLVETYHKAVYHLCFRMLGNHEDAEDASQETFLRAFRSLKRYDLNRPFSTWLLSIAAHHCIDLIRKRRMRIVSIENLPVPHVQDPSPEVETSMISNQERRNIQEVLAVLHSLDRAIVVMYYWYEFSYHEIAEALRLSTSAVKSRLHRARRAMAQSWMERQKRLQETTDHSLEEPNFLTERMLP